MQDNCRLSGPGASQQLHLPKGWPCPGMVRMLPAAAGRSAQGNRSTPLHWDTGILLAPQPQALGAPAGQGGSSLPRCCPCSWVTFTTSICVIFSMHTAPLCQDSCCRMHGSHFFSLLEVFTFPSGGKTDATPELLAESLVLPAAPGIPKKWGSQDLFPAKLGSVIKQCIP